MNIKLEEVLDAEKEIPKFAEYEKKIFKIKKSFQEAWERYLKEDRRLTFCYLKEQEQVIGVLGFTLQHARNDSTINKKGDKFSFLMAIAIEEEYRKNGFGEKLLQFFIEKSKRENVKTLALRVDPRNDVAISLYKKHGFIDCFENENSLYMYMEA